MYFHIYMVLYVIALDMLLFNLQNFVYSFIDMDNNNQKKRKKNCKCKIDVRLSLKMGGMLYMVRAAVVGGPLSYITC